MGPCEKQGLCGDKGTYIMKMAFSIVRGRHSKNAVEKAAQIIFTVCAFFAVLAVFSITLYMLINGTPALFKVGLKDILFGTVWKPTAKEPSFGILYIILTSIVGTAFSIAIGVPIGVLTAVFLAMVMCVTAFSVTALASGGEDRQDDRDGGLVLGGGLVDGDAATVVDDLDAAVCLERDFDVIGVACQGLVDGVVDDLVDEVVQTAFAGGSDVHARALADGFQALEDGDVRCAVGLLAFGGLRVGSHVAPLALRENRGLAL